MYAPVGSCFSGETNGEKRDAHFNGPAIGAKPYFAFPYGVPTGIAIRTFITCVISTYPRIGLHVAGRYQELKGILPVFISIKENREIVNVRFLQIIAGRILAPDAGRIVVQVSA